MTAGYWERRWTGFREGTRRVELTWDGGSAGAVLYDAGVPRTVQAMLERLPLRSEVIHVAWSGDMLLTSEPVELGVRELENEVKNPLPGDIGFDPRIDEITFTYGVAECHMPIGPNTIVIVGNIDHNLQEFAEFARARRFEGVGRLELHETQDR